MTQVQNSQMKFGYVRKVIFALVEILLSPISNHYESLFQLQTYLKG